MDVPDGGAHRKELAGDHLHVPIGDLEFLL
jgi:hypothetical protein